MLRSRFVVAGGRVEIRVDAAGARYPVTIDPTWTTLSTPTATLTNAAGAAADRFGSDVALSADGNDRDRWRSLREQRRWRRLHLPCPSAEGGPWRLEPSTPVATLTDSTGTGGDTFGGDVALSADWDDGAPSRRQRESVGIPCVLGSVVGLELDADRDPYQRRQHQRVRWRGAVGGRDDSAGGCPEGQQRRRRRVRVPCLRKGCGKLQLDPHGDADQRCRRVRRQLRGNGGAVS